MTGGRRFLDSLRMLAGCQGNEACDYRAGISAPSSPNSPTHPPPISRDGRGAGDKVVSPVFNDLINHAYIMKPPKKKNPQPRG